MSPATLIEQALKYARYNWSIIPMRPHEKRPMIRWQEYQQHRATEEQIKNWYQRWPDMNIGVVTGQLSGIVVLDVDPRHGGDSNLEKWEQQHGQFPDTVEVITGGGGRHLYFKHPGEIIHNRVSIVAGIDLRGDGGCAVLPPSIHPSGKAYRWRAGHEPDNMDMAELPGWLLQRLLNNAHHGK